MNENQRAEFEAWISSPPYEKSVGINPETSGFPGQYRAYEVQLAWEAYQAGYQAALQSQEREDAERLNKMFRAFGLKGLEDLPDWPCSFGETCELEDMIENGYLRQTFDEWISAIDHARRIEGGAK